MILTTRGLPLSPAVEAVKDVPGDRNSKNAAFVEAVILALPVIGIIAYVFFGEHRSVRRR